MRDQSTAWTGRMCSASVNPYKVLPPIVINGKTQDVREGTGAIRAHEAMMYGVEKSDQLAKEAWCELLKQYCELDTFEHGTCFWVLDTGRVIVVQTNALRDVGSTAWFH